MKLEKAIEYVRDAETELASQLRSTGERHAVEHDLYHLGHTLAQQCASRVGQLVPFADKYGTSLHQEKIASSPGVLAALRQKSSEMIGRSEESGLLLLHDLRQLYLAAQKAEIHWVILGQAAQAIRDSDLLHIAQSCREQAETTGKWLRTRIKESSPQVIATG